YIQTQVMPFYGNTHTTTSITGLQSTAFREEARGLIAEAVKAAKHKDAVIFTGSGSTGAVHKLVHILGLHLPHPKMSKRPVVFVGPFEHHSNLLPWRESHCDVVQIHESDQGLVDMAHLTQMLKKYAGRPLKIGSFSAASNVTGIVSDVNAIASLLHTHGALAFFDYASCAPYVDMDMNAGSLSYKDAIFFSGHKFLGGPGSPGVLVVKKKLFMTDVPTTPGGGTVLYVTQNDHYYVNHIEEREEGGTPDIIGSIRLGMAFQIKQRTGTTTIMQCERANLSKVMKALDGIPQVVVLGRCQNVDKLPIISFLIRSGDRFLHYNFVGALLNDLFGIQSRGGCACAGPYGHRLLGISKAHTAKLNAALLENFHVLKPGFTRVSFPYILSDAEVEYVVEAIKFVARHGWKFLWQYEFRRETGEWFHTSLHLNKVETPQLRGFFTTSLSLPNAVEACKSTYKLYLDKAHALARVALCHFFCLPNPLPSSKDQLRWFLYPWDIVSFIQRDGNHVYLACHAIVGPVNPSLYCQLPSQSRTIGQNLWGRLALHVFSSVRSPARGSHNSHQLGRQ
ncbi:hypothetical protein AeRB84_014021, partial [Aphanomyces euteiches]